MKRVIMGLGAAALAALIAGGYLYGQSTGNTPRYRTVRVERGPLSAAVSASGTLNPVVTVQVGSQLSGQIKAISVDYNSPVKKGQTIALIAPEIFESKVRQARADLENTEAAVLNQRALVQRARADLENARASLAVAQTQTARAEIAVVDARRDLERKRELHRRGLIALSERDVAQTLHDSVVTQLESGRAQERVVTAGIRSAEAQLEAARAQLESAQALVRQRQGAVAQAQVDLNSTVIRAPIDGIVVSRSVDVGQTVAASLQAPTLFTIAQDLSRMQVETSILEADVGRVRVGQRATFTVDAFPGKTFAGEVVQLRQSPQIVQGVVSYNVVISAQNPGARLLPGMTANVKIVTAEKRDVLKVPIAALRVRLSAGETGAIAQPDENARTGQGGAAQAGDEKWSGLAQELGLGAEQRTALAAIIRERRDRIDALKGGDELSRAERAERRAKRQAVRDGAEQRIHALLTPEQRARYERLRAERPSAPDGAGEGPAARIHVLAPDGSPRVVTVRLGISDGTATEVSDGVIKEGQEVIVGLADLRPAKAGKGGGVVVRF